MLVIYCPNCESEVDAVKAHGPEARDSDFYEYRRYWWNVCLTCGAQYSAPPYGHFRGAERTRRLERAGQTNMYKR